MSDIEFIAGLIVKAPNANAPDYVKAKLSIKREDLIAWLTARSDEWINADIKESKGGKWYAAVDNWKPEGRKQERSTRGSGPARPAPQPQRPQPADDFIDDDIPFR